MKDIFNFNLYTHDFWSIYDSIRKYYPIGIKRGENGIYFDYPGIKALEKIVVERVHDQANYENNWVAFTEQCQDELKYPVKGTTYGQEPSYSAYVELSKFVSEEVDSSKELHFAVSFLGPFYTVIGMHKTFVPTQRGDKFLERVNRVVVSPLNEFEIPFIKMMKKIESRFNGYRYVPFFINQMFIDGLRVRYRDDEENRVYHALFNQLIDFEAMKEGDQYSFGTDIWQIDNS
ncbi:MAG: hypothetical protein AAFX87_28435 [Bacteroidota bacterium]